MRAAPSESHQFSEFTICLRIDTLIQQDLRRYIDVIDSAWGIRPSVWRGFVKSDGSRRIPVR